MATETLTLPNNHPNSKIRVTLTSRPKKDAEPEPFLEPSLRTNHIEDFTQEEISEAIDTVLKTSIYAGASRELMVNAINDTVHGRMSLTQAAAKFGIPFSTIHPYVKKLRQRLGLAEPVPDAKKPRSAKRKPPVVKEGESDGADGQTGIRKHRKKRSPPPGYVPFKQIIIPEHWKLFPEKMKDAVWTAVSFCNYDNVEKKQRLCQAILDVMIGQKTLKAAASNNNIPFTTLQTYFHRSRITMERCMETDEEVLKAKPLDDEMNRDEISLDEQLALLSTLSQEQIFSMLMNSDTSRDQIDALRTTASTPSTERSTGRSVDAVSDWLISKKMNENGERDGGSPGMQMNGEQTGSRKRKPQVVKRVNDGLNISISSNSNNGMNPTSQLSDFLEERFGLTMMKNDTFENNDDDEENSGNKLDNITLEKLHLPSVLNSEHKLAKVLINYYINNKLELKDKASPSLLKLFENAVIDVSSNLTCQEISGDDFDTHLDIINDLMTTLPRKYALFKFKILPDKSNFIQGKDILRRNIKLYHGCLLSEPPKTLRELMTSYLRRQIVDYIESIALAGFPITNELVHFLINQVIRDRSIPELYTSNEYDEQFKRITNSEKLRKFF